VIVGQAAREHPRSEEAQQFLGRYLGYINARRFADAFNLLTPRFQQALNGEQTFTTNMSTTKHYKASLQNLTDSAGALIAEVHYHSVQAAEYGPRGETCTKWYYRYFLTASAGTLRIEGADFTSEFCA
jgi:hypothetical protein